MTEMSNPQMSASAMLVRLIQMLVQRISDEEALTQMILCRERLLKQRQNILDGIANNPKADYRARVEAHHLAGEITTVIMKLHMQAPSMSAQRQALPVTPLTAQGTIGVKLVLKKKQQHRFRYVKPSDIVRFMSLADNMCRYDFGIL
jgi:hypothetical protein